ncbi:MAG: LacI family DNA-binding transcriptional regulator [Actinomycetota bacterium]
MEQESETTALAGQRATVRDIAHETGVSIATVSRVLNNRANVAPATRALVDDAVRRRGAHAPSARSRSPRDARGGAVFVRCPYVLTDYFGIIVSSIAETLARRGRCVILDAGEASQGTSVLDAIRTAPDVSGAILVLPPEPDADLVALQRKAIPLVVVDPRTTLPRDIASVSAAHFAGARALSSHLVELGHRRIGVIGGPESWLASGDRLAGHAAALAAAGVLPSPDLVRHVHATSEDGYAAAGEFLDMRDRPTALVAFNDKVAVGALRAAAERGLRVPADLSITGFDDIDLSEATSPMLTTVRQPLQEMGRMAVSVFMRIIEHHAHEALHIELATELVVRGSTGPVPTPSP